MKSHAWWSIDLDKEGVSKLLREYPANTERLDEDLLHVFADSEELGDLLRFLNGNPGLVAPFGREIRDGYLYVWVEEEPAAYFDVKLEDMQIMLELGLSLNLTFD